MDIEDNKGNPGIKGTFHITNLRILWFNNKNNSINLSIGLNTIISMHQKNDYQLEGSIQTLTLKCKSDKNRYEFIFVTILPELPNKY